MKMPRVVMANVVLFLAVSLVTANASAADWVKVEPAGWKCEAMFPEKPTDSGADGGMQYILELDGGKSALMLQGDKLPKAIDVKDTATVMKIFDTGREGMLKGFEGSKLIGEKNSRLNNKSYPTREIDIDVPESGIYRTRSIFDGSRIYLVAVFGPKAFVDGEVAKKFMDSVKLTD